MQTKKKDKNERELNVIELLHYFFIKWYWFLISVLFFGGIAWVIYASSPLIYSCVATVLIKDPDNKTISADWERFENFINKSNVTNEIYQFKSKELMREVVERLNADVTYKIKRGFRQNELYTQSPVVVKFLDATPNTNMSFTLEIRDFDTVFLSDVLVSNSDFLPSVDLKDREVKLNDTIAVGQQSIMIVPTSFYTEEWLDRKLMVVKHPIERVVAYFQSRLNIQLEEENSSILTLSINDGSPYRAQDVLNALIFIYNEETIKDKNRVAINTGNFINERLAIIGEELGELEGELESFKEQNEMVNVRSSTELYMGESKMYNQDALKLETELSIAQLIKEYLTDPIRETSLIPTNTGINMNIENMIAEYNETKLRRDRLLVDSSLKNPRVENLNNSLVALKQTILAAVDNVINSVDKKRADAKNRQLQAQTQVVSIPQKERQIISIERQQKIKEDLYLFLLNRREENALSQAMADDNALVIDSADGSMFPVSPDRDKILLFGLLLGLAFPGVIFFLVFSMDTRVYGRKDIEGIITIPYLGEIPLDKSIPKRRSGMGTIYDSRYDSDSVVAEAFRILRANMSFMIKKNKGTQVITLASFNAGAGKTFISHNLARCMVSAKRRVILVDLDIRKGSLSRYYGLDGLGMTNYLSDSTIEIDDVIQKLKDFDIIAAGQEAPNPAELLMDERLDIMIKELRSRYDYIIIDNVPVGIVADATITNRVVDMTLFVMRSGRFDCRQLPDIQQIYDGKKLKNLAVLLNGVDLKRHGNVYGYSYNRSYGYSQSRYSYR